MLELATIHVDNSLDADVEQDSVWAQVATQGGLSFDNGSVGAPVLEPVVYDVEQPVFSVEEAKASKLEIPDLTLTISMRDLDASENPDEFEAVDDLLQADTQAASGSIQTCNVNYSAMSLRETVL